MPDIDIAFLGKDRAASALAAQDFRRQVVAAGVPPAAVVFKRSNAEEMSGPDIIGLLVGAIAAAKPFVETTGTVLGGIQIAMAIYGICVKERCAVRITMGDRSIELTRGEIEVEQLRSIIDEFANAAAAK
jgi:hypothetical protein